MPSPIIDKIFTLEKMEGKGAWTYVLLPLRVPKTGLPFGWYIVKGKIDDYEIEQFKLWPTKEGELFLPVKKAIRKKIKKEAGDRVHVVLYEDNSPLQIPEEFTLVLADYPNALTFFNTISDTSKKQYIDYIYQGKGQETRDRRMSKVIEKLEARLKYHE